ncbi:MAG TPA: hypothetical protein VL147_03270, partial [Devosia sp.]|nr:hypothetical protein [Devosia sp.]
MAAPTNINFDGLEELDDGNASLSIWQGGGWTVSFLNNSSIDYIYVENNEPPIASGADHALSVIGDAPGLGGDAVSFAWTSGEEFSLQSFAITAYFAGSDSMDPDIRVIGYRDGSVIGAATQDFSLPTDGSVLTVTFSGAAWGGIDEFRIVQQNGTRDFYFLIDDIAVGAGAVNTSPVVGGDGTETLTSTVEDTANAALTNTVSSLFGGQYDDSADAFPTAFAGIAVVANGSTTGTGQWQYYNGSAWVNIGTASTSSAVTIAASTALRFLPATDFNGATPSLTVKLVDSSGGALTNGTIVNVTTSGGTTAYSSGTVVLDHSVTAINDTPTVPSTATTVGATEQTAAALLGSVAVSDIELDALNSGNGNYADASFTVQRAAANAADSFGFASGGLFTVSGSNLQLGGLTFATFTNTGGVLTVSFTSSGTAATTALVSDVIKHITYTNTSDAPPSSVTLIYTLNDGAPGNGQGSGGSATAGGSVVVNITAVNDIHSGGASVTGTAAEDQVLTAVSTLADADGLGTLHYQWQRDTGSGYVNVGSDQTTYTLGDGDIGGVVRVVIYYTDAGGTVESATSSGTAVITATNDAPAGGVSITGTATENQVLTANTAALSDADGLGTLHYQWQRDTGSGYVNVGTDQTTYTLGDGDVGGTVRVVVSYTDGQGFSNSVTSGGTSAIAAVNDPHTGGVSISGTATENQMLTAVSTLADADGLGALHYQWQRDTGSGYVNVGTDQATYTLGDSDVGGIVRVVISYTDSQGF